MNYLIYGCCLLAAYFVAVCFTWNVREVARVRGWTASPHLSRHIHTIPIPRLGGVAIFGTFVTAVSLLSIVKAFWLPSLEFFPETIVLVLIPGALIFLVGLIDDLRGLSAHFKFIAQTIAGLMLYAFGFRVILPFHLANAHAEYFLSIAVTVFWVLWISNSFNLIDGLDGLAAGTALISTLAVFVASIWSGNQFVALLVVIFAGALLGFLRFNFNPATIFLGDCGSLFIGFMLSAVALAGRQSKTPTVLAVVIPAVSFGLPLTETALSVLRRFISGKPLFTADREHIHHKLLDLGLSHRQVVMVLYGVSALCAVSGLVMLHRGTWVLVVCLLGAILLLGVRHLGYHEFFELRRLAQRTGEQKRVVANNLYIRKTTERLRDATHLEDVRCILEDAFQDNDFDGFELVLVPSSKQPQEVNKSTPHDSIAWSKFDGIKPALGDTWSLVIELSTSKSGELGYFRMFRYYNQGSLLIDINLITSDLKEELSKVVEVILGSKFIKSESSAEAAPNFRSRFSRQGKKTFHSSSTGD